MSGTVCDAHMHPLPCPGYACRPTDAPALVEAAESFRAKVAAGDLPPWIPELRLALSAGRAWLRREMGDADYADSTREHADARIVDLRRAGWDGENVTVWRAAESMAKFTGAMPGLPQRGCELREIERWQEQRDPE